MGIFHNFTRMNFYLKEVKKSVLAARSRPLLVVMGNESVDLDSAVSSISIAYHLNKVKNSHLIPVAMKNENFLVAPVINATKEEIPLKTEVTHWLKKHDVDLENLLCRDEIDLTRDAQNFVLVDHHVSQFHEKVISVLDHRPFDNISNLTEDCFKNIREVGSCATLVVDAIRKDVSEETLKADYDEVLKLCYGTITLDTINFSKEADKVRAMDFEVGEFLEKFLGIENVLSHRKILYDELVTARADVSTLNSLQLLSKDLKIISSENGSVRVAIPGVDVYQYVKMVNAEANVKTFAKKNNIDVVVLMGMRPAGDSIERFLAVIDIKNAALFTAVLGAITSMKNPDLLLESRKVDFMNGEFFDQKNIKASRKQILPVIKGVLNQY